MEDKRQVANNGYVRLDLKRDGGFELKAEFEFPEVGITSIFGESGSGKTTVLRCVAGLERGNGFVRIGNHVWQDDDKGLFLPTWQRPLGYVFQEASLFPHLSARGNIEFAVKRSSSSNARQRMETAIELLGIGHLLDRKPAQLSGGERQRVAIARAVATEPNIMLFDEPLAALDFARKAEILPWLEKLRTELRIPMLYVTHSAEEVMRLADNLVVLHKGDLLAAGPVQEVLSNVKVPISLGGDTGVLIKGEVTSVDQAWKTLTLSNGKVNVVLPDTGHQVGEHLNIRVLANEVSISASPAHDSSILNCLEGVVTEVVHEQDGYDSLVQVECSGQLILARITNKSISTLQIQSGSKVWVMFKATSVRIA